MLSPPKLNRFSNKVTLENSLSVSVVCFRVDQVSIVAFVLQAIVENKCFQVLAAGISIKVFTSTNVEVTKLLLCGKCE